MISNLEKYKKDLERVISKGSLLSIAIRIECCSAEEKKSYINQLLKDSTKEERDTAILKLIDNLPSFREDYQSWYSESLSIVKLLIPDRLNDFAKLYEKPKPRKDITNSNYVIEDYLQGISINRGLGEIIVSPSAAIPQFDQQLNILKSAKRRFESSLFDIKQLIQADLFDSELDAARELNNKGFVRGAGAIAGVVLEGHLLQVCENHNLKIKKKNPSINYYNDLLKDNKIINIKDWRFIQHLGDLRNLCDHKKSDDPNPKEIDELIVGTDKITKTLY